MSIRIDSNRIITFQVESLREKLNATRDKREELERLREDLIKHLKQIHNRINVRRKEGS